MNDPLLPRIQSSQGITTALDKCPACGAEVAGGRTACQNLYDEMQTRAYTDLHYGAVHMLAFDTYCMQHLNTYCRSAKSYATHLTRLCCGLKYGGDQKIYAAIQRWLNGQAVITRPVPPTHLGKITILDVSKAPTPEIHQQIVRKWAENVWEAYASQHELACSWIAAALHHTP